MELKRYWRVLKKKLWLIITCVLLATSAAGVISYWFTKPVYQATSKIIVNYSKSYDQLNPNLTLDSIQLDVKLIETYKLIIQTPAILNKVVELYPDLNMTERELNEMIRVSNVKDTLIMTLTAQHTSYEKAVNVVNAVAKVAKQEIPVIMAVDNVTILNEAIPSDLADPVSPHPLMNIIAGFMVSLLAAIGLVFLLDYMDDTIKTEEDVEELLGLTTLAVMVKMKKEDLSSRIITEEATNRKLGESVYVAVNK
ncbi:MAG: lipopolysaccharide biosynthesis protein [Paenibacillaceae bacterium]|jgi:capsular polysaccharide biosynthesis protein|nr:lipopolysaccharide biosynthesis protein [Paenibacillaceae bacterium]